MKRFCLSPMAGFTDPAFRVMCAKNGADFAITEMVSADGIIRGKEDETLLMPSGSPPTAVQLFGSDPKVLLKACESFEKSKFSEININAGCPVKKVVKKGAGAELLKNRKRLEEIVEQLSGSIKKPISVKIRLGYDKKSDSIEIAKMLEKKGCDSIIVHARTAKQMYSGDADWSYIKKIKENVSIKVFGNGDIQNWKDAYRMITETSCNGVYIGRAASANPLIFKEIKKKISIENNKENVKKWIYEYFKLRKKLNLKSSSMKAIAVKACRTFEGAKEMRMKIAQSKTDEEIVELFR
ncbi:MAG: tRNA-dihydrouridine synthase family protein [Candidatus ainarchaeum sp.]|nr:tRNA-dihydrouridine synthase family protein [Candidatus ainarchaeum sp.]